VLLPVTGVSEFGKVRKRGTGRKRAFEALKQDQRLKLRLRAPDEIASKSLAKKRAILAHNRDRSGGTFGIN
jgi:hypothetical protein